MAGLESLHPPEGKPSCGHINILLLGETGVGKSTWINGFSNFLKYSTLVEAENSPIECLIPASFTMTDADYNEYRVSTGSDVNEITEVGQSATQLPHSYIFEEGGDTIRIIDTPGIGDVRGPDQDKKNFVLILDHISHLDDIHVICILLKPNNSRLSIMFSFCIKELLTHLHKDACRNIVFCFTNSRGTNYRPGETYPSLKKLFAHERIGIEVNQSTIYCIDNDSIRFLYAAQHGFAFTEEDRVSYISSWDKSVSEVRRLLSHAAKLEAHSIINTISLNRARRTILALRDPIAEISKNIQTNIAISERKKEELLSYKSSKEDLSKNLVIEETDVAITILSDPRTVCAARRCVEIVKVGTQTKLNYKTHCHLRCQRGKGKHYKIVNMKGHKGLKKCSAFSNGGKCSHCGCSWRFHMKITYETSTILRRVVDNAVEQKMKREDSAIKKVEIFQNSLIEHLEELIYEEGEITRASVKFACFLKQNSIISYNDDLPAYLTNFINDECEKGSGSDEKLIRGLEKMRDNCNEQMEILQKAMTEGGEVSRVSATDIENCIIHLFNLRHCGQNLKQVWSILHNTPASNEFAERHVQGVSMNDTKRSDKRNGLFSVLTDLFRSQRANRTPRIPVNHTPVIASNNRNPSEKPVEKSICDDARKSTETMDAKWPIMRSAPSGSLIGPQRLQKKHEERINIQTEIAKGSKAISYGPATSEDLQVVPRAKLTVMKEIGTGGFGAVQSGSWNGTNCAIKQIKSIVTNEVGYQDILREARTQYNLKHPNIVQLYGISYDGDLWLIMQLITGDNLYNIFIDSNRQNKSKVTAKTKVKMALQATNAISYLHGKGYLHNDIKPKNMIIEERTGCLFVCDFGITRYLGGQDIQSFSTKYTNSFGGTLPYIAPECFQRDSAKRHIRPTFKSDVWGLGAVFLELFLEEEIFSDDNAIYTCKLLEDYTRIKKMLKRLPIFISTIIRQAIDSDPENRPSGREMNIFFQNVLSDVECLELPKLTTNWK